MHSLKERAGSYVSARGRDFKQWGTDIKNGELRVAGGKTVKLVKTSGTRVYKLMKWIIHEILHLLRNFKKFFSDVKFFVWKSNQVRFVPFARYSYQEMRRMPEIRSDILKFIPFSFFIIIPGAEILLPAYLAIFPNAIPTQFVSEVRKSKAFADRLKLKDVAGSRLAIYYLQQLKHRENDPSLSPEEQNNVWRLRRLAKDIHALPTDLLTHKETFVKHVQGHFSHEALKDVCMFHGLLPKTGFNAINLLLQKIFKVEIPIDAPIVGSISRVVLERQIRLHYRKLRREDMIIHSETLEEVYPLEVIHQMCLDRGIEIADKPLT